ncbi:hypothetical protein [Haladaptatus cibarius]|uniref:hypothetical protein n=1 Tax=Haladaptatus cibarius TaxID=453847 RepID=UPI0006785F26|nr:hypothetical protein [Haladaptatus cibarius]
MSQSGHARFEQARTVPDANPNEEPDWVEIKENGAIVTGEILEIKENCGEHGSTVYKLKPDEEDADLGISGDEPILFWGTTVVNSKVSRVGLDVGDWLGVKCRGKVEAEDEDANDFWDFEVRFQRHD